MEPKQAKPKTGKLWYAKQVIEKGQPFAFLQGLKKQLVMQGYDKALFKITY